MGAGRNRDRRPFAHRLSRPHGDGLRRVPGVGGQRVLPDDRNVSRGAGPAAAKDPRLRRDRVAAHRNRHREVKTAPLASRRASIRLSTPGRSERSLRHHRLDAPIASGTGRVPAVSGSRHRTLRDRDGRHRHLMGPSLHPARHARGMSVLIGWNSALVFVQHAAQEHAGTHGRNRGMPYAVPDGRVPASRSFESGGRIGRRGQGAALGSFGMAFMGKRPEAHSLANPHSRRRVHPRLRSAAEHGGRP